MVINKKIIRSMSENKSRYLGSFILIVLSSLLYTAVSLSFPSVKAEVDQFMKESVVEDANFIVGNPIQDIPALEEQYDMILEERKSIDIAAGEGSTLRIFSATRQLDKYCVVEGNGLSKSGEILLEQPYANEHAIKIGDSFTINKKAYLIAGFMSLPDYLYVLKSESDLLFNHKAFGIAVVSPSDFMDFQNPFTFYSVKFNQDNISAFKEEINKSNPIMKWTNKEDNPRIDAFFGDINGNIKMGEVMPISILFMTCLLLAVVLWRLLKAEFIQIGTLFALGYRKRELLGHYLTYPILLSLLGSIAGIVPGLFLAKPFTLTQGLQYNLPRISIHYDIKHLLIAFLLPFLLLVPTSTFVILKALKMTPLVLMKGGANKTKISFLEKRLKLDKLSFNTKFRIRETVRNIPRTLVMIFGVTLASMFLLFGFSMISSLNGVIDEGYNQTFLYEDLYLYKTVQTEVPISGEKILVHSVKAQDKNSDDLTFKIQGMQEDSKLIYLEDEKGKSLTFNQVIITKPLAQKLGIKEKDSLHVQSKITGKDFTFVVMRIANTYVGDFVFMPIDQINSLLGLKVGSYTGLLSNKTLDIAPEQLIASISKDDIVEGFQSSMGILKVFSGVIAFIAFIIGLIIIYIVVSLIIEENKANISLLKILGYSKKRVYSLILNSNIILVVIGYLLSIPLILAAMNQLLLMITSQMDVTVPAKLDPLYMLVGGMIIWFTYELSKLLSRKKIIHIPMVDSLKNREA